MEDDATPIGQALNEIRDEYGHSDDQISTAVGMHPITVKFMDDVRNRCVTPESSFGSGTAVALEPADTNTVALAEPVDTDVVVLDDRAAAAIRTAKDQIKLAEGKIEGIIEYVTGKHGWKLSACGTKLVKISE